MQYNYNKNLNINSSRNNNNFNFGYKTFYAKSEPGISNIINFDNDKPLYFLNKNNYKKDYKYNKLFFYSNEKIFMKEIKKYKDNQRKMNSNKMNKFHTYYIHSKMKSYSESPDYNEITSNNKTTTYSETTSNNYSKTIKNKYSILKNISILKSNNRNKTRNNNFLNINNYLKTENDKNFLYQSATNRNHSILKTAHSKRNNNLTINSSLIKRINIYNYVENKLLKNKSPTKVLNYKFNDIIGNVDNNVYCEGKLTSSRGVRNGLTEQILSEFRFNIFNKIKKEFYETKFEIKQDPLSIIEEYRILLETNKKYYNIYQGLIKKYFGYLYSQIDEEKYKLMILKEEREKIKEENFQITKKINSQNEKLIFYQNFMKLLLKIKYNTVSLSIIHEDDLIKYGIKKGRRKSNHKLLKRNTYFLITEIKNNNKHELKRKTTFNINFNKKMFFRTKSNNYNDIHKTNRDSIYHELNNFHKKHNKRLSNEKALEYEIIPKVPIFNDVEELFGRLKGIENHLKDLYKESADKRYMIQILKTELYKEKSRDKTDKNYKINNNELNILMKKLSKIKEKYEIYMHFKNYLNSIKDKNYIEFEPKIKEINNDKDINKKHHSNKKDNVKKKVVFADKIISILLNLNINIEKFIEIKGIYSFLRSPQEVKINSQGKEYMKALFCIKILEIIFLKLMEKRQEFLLKSSKRKKYLEYEDVIEKNNKLMKIYEKREEEINQRIKREREILIKASKVPIVPRKKDDPFSYNIYYEQFKRNEKERLKKIRKNQEIENIFKNLISY